MTNLPCISYVIPVKNDAARLRHCLWSIASDPYPAERREIIVVDNGSSDDSARVGAEFGARTITLPDLGVAQLRNRGADAARGSILAFVDADHELAPGWAAATADTMSRNDAVAAGELCHAPANGSWVQRAYDAFRPRSSSVREVTWLGSGNLAVRRDVFLAARGFDASLVACEDVDLCQRLRAQGHRIVADPRMHSVHFGDPATLRQLFRGELWRGQNNFRVSLRRPLVWRDLPSIVLPVLQAGCGLGAAASVIAALAGAWPWLVPGMAVAAFLGLSVPRALRMALNRPAGPWKRLAPYYAVALVYDAARALALLLPRGHHR